MTMASGRQHVERDRDRVAQALGAEGHLVGEHGQHHGGPARPALGENVDDGEVVEGPDRREQHHDDHDVAEPGQGHVEETLERGGPVDRRCLVELAGNGLHAGQEQIPKNGKPRQMFTKITAAMAVPASESQPTPCGGCGRP